MSPDPVEVRPEPEGAARTEDEPATRRSAEAADVQLRYHEPSGRWMVVVRDPITGRVLETWPPEALLEAIGRIRAVLGLLVDAGA